MVRTVILRTAGTNCDLETEHAFRLVGSDVERVHINRFMRKEKNLDDYHILVIPGGFTYGDDISAGVLLANEMQYGLAEPLQRFVRDGKLILGICNGFQVLVKAGLLPLNHGSQDPQSVTLTFNDSGKFEDRWTYMKVNEESPCIFTRGIEGLFYIPVAHAEGKFVARDEQTLESLWEKKQVPLQYVNGQGEPAGYPWNPNGSLDNIAGLCDPAGRIFGLMPHPERHVHPTHHPRWTRGVLQTEGQGLQIFRNAVLFAQKNL